MTALRRKMTLEQFRSTLVQPAPPADLSPALQAMWEDATGNWNAAHSIAQGIEDDMGSLIHAYLHRKAGDLGSAGYWYRRAKSPAASDQVEEEWTRIVLRLLRAGAAVLDDE